ncbi:MAG: aromatic amino acid lyase [Deltaproteobacteria bacterium]|nr:aromatic amino acid lyase [Deltaproteobacteria bacterium]
MDHDRKTAETVVLDGRSLRIQDLVDAARGRRDVSLAPGAWERIRQGRSVVERIVAEGTPAYGITTGVGAQKDHPVGREQMIEYNRRLLAAHATRVPGPTLEPEVVRAAMVIQANLFATGSCGVRPDLVRLILHRLKEGRLPRVDASGSVGASDLVPLAQLALGLLEETFSINAKEALSLMNSNAVSLALGSLNLHELDRLLAAFDLSAAMALEGLRGNLASLSEPVVRSHGLRGQGEAAARIRGLLSGSRLWEAGSARFLQDPLSFRCVSQIHGAGLHALEWARNVWETELNTITDNPLIDLESGTTVSHGNMDSTVMTMVADTMGQILAKIADLSGERMNKQHWPAFSGLPTGLTEERGRAVGGVQFLNFSHIAASLIASIKIWAQPHLLHAIGQLNDGVEDTAGLALHAVADLQRQIEAGWKVAALEMMTGAWALQRRGIPQDDLGAGVAVVVQDLVPRLPIGREGQGEPFDMAPVVDRIRKGGLLEEAYAAAGGSRPLCFSPRGRADGRVSGVEFSLPSGTGAL